MRALEREILLSVALAIIVGKGVLAAVGCFFDAVFLGFGFLGVGAVVAGDGAAGGGGQADAAVAAGRRLGIVLAGVAEHLIGCAVPEVDAKTPIGLADVAFDDVFDIFAVAQAAHAVHAVADELVVLDGAARDPGAEKEAVAQVVLGNAIEELALCFPSAGMNTRAAAAFDHAVGDAIVSTFLNADAVGGPTANADVFDQAVRHFDEVDGREREAEILGRALWPLADGAGAWMLGSLRLDGQVLEDDVCELGSGDGGEVVDDGGSFGGIEHAADAAVEQDFGATDFFDDGVSVQPADGGPVKNADLIAGGETCGVCDVDRTIVGGGRTRQLAAGLLAFAKHRLGAGAFERV